jgi:hypothetical protein
MDMVIFVWDSSLTLREWRDAPAKAKDEVNIEMTELGVSRKILIDSYALNSPYTISTAFQGGTTPTNHAETSISHHHARTNAATQLSTPTPPPNSPPRLVIETR